jgi:hypothetical protein
MKWLEALAFWRKPKVVLPSTEAFLHVIDQLYRERQEVEAHLTYLLKLAVMACGGELAIAREIASLVAEGDFAIGTQETDSGLLLTLTNIEGGLEETA